MLYPLAGIASFPFACLAMPALCKMLTAASAKLKPEGEVKVEPSSATPSPSKRLATEMDKKIKDMKGDTTLVKDFHVFVDHSQSPQRIWKNMSTKLGNCETDRYCLDPGDCGPPHPIHDRRDESGLLTPGERRPGCCVWSPWSPIFNSNGELV